MSNNTHLAGQWFISWLCGFAMTCIMAALSFRPDGHIALVMAFVGLVYQLLSLTMVLHYGIKGAEE